MNSENLAADIKIKIEEGLRYLVPVSLGLLLFIFLIRGYEIIFIWPSLVARSVKLNLLPQTMLYELITYFEIVAVAGSVFIIITLFLKRTAKVLLIASYLLVILWALILVLYFSKTRIPLGSDLFGYSLFEINETVRAAGGINVLYFIYLFGFLAVCTLIFILFSKIKLTAGFNKFFYFFSLITFLFLSALNPQSQDYANTSEYYSTVNKFQFFTSKSYSHFFEKELEIPIYNFYIESEDSADTSIRYTDVNYPFLHEENSPDVLSNFFNIGEKKPNFVFIITESLGKGYSGENAYLGSFTPFLDSLARHSLYWENFLSTGGRTFAVLPSLFGSLPFGEKGFLEMGNNMPPHFSLINYLKRNGYKVHFFYGGDSHFDMMDNYLRRSKVDLLIDVKNFGNNYKKMPADAGGYSWGYGDKELFKRSFDLLNLPDRKNQLNIYLTLSIHSPFLVENMDYYRKKFDMITDEHRIRPELKSKVKMYKDMLACVLYTDDAFREFFEDYKKRDDYQNTIFIITGDHRMPEIPAITQIDRFHVPFLIYSPLLKRSAKISSVSSHFDLTPSLLPFLSKNYGMEKVTQSTFIGTGLDTARELRNIHRYPLMRNKKELLDYLYKGYFYSDQKLYRIIDNLGLVPSEEKYMEAVIGNEFLEYKKRNEIMIKTKRLMPGNLLN